MHLTSRFLIMTAQTREFPTMPVITSMDVTVVMATSAGSDMTEGCQCRSFNLGEKEAFYYM